MRRQSVLWLRGILFGVAALGAACDGAASSAVSTPAVDVIAQDVAVTTPEDTPVKGAFDVTGADAFTVRAVTKPKHGSVDVGASGFTYTPAGDFNGADTFTYEATAGDVSARATVRVTISPVNDAPTLADDAYVTAEDTPVILEPAGDDVDGDALTYEIVAEPVHGTLADLGDGRFRYTPAADWFGTDAVQLKANDGDAASEAAVFTVAVDPVNDAPYFTAVTGGGQVVDPGAVVALSAAAADTDGDPVTLTWLEDGVVIGTGAAIQVTAPENTHAERTLTIQAGDGASVGEATVAVRTRGANLAGITATPGAAAGAWTFAAAVSSYDGASAQQLSWRIAGSAVTTGAATTIGWTARGMPGVYEIAVTVTDTSGYTGWFTAAAAITVPAEWMGWCADLQSTSQHLWTEGLGAAMLPAPIETTGAVVYAVFVGVDAHGPLSLSSDGVLLGTHVDSQVFARRAEDGAALWTYDMWNYGPKPAFSVNGTAFAAAQGGTFYAFRPDDGFLYWSQSVAGGHSRDLVLGADGRIYAAGDGAASLRAVNPSDGSTLWNRPLPAAPSTNVVVGVGGHSYVGAGSTVYSVYADGTTEWASTISAEALIGMALGSDGTIYVGGSDNALYALAPTGGVTWSLDVGQDINPPKIGPDGTIYVKTTNGALVAVSPDGVQQWAYGSLGTYAPAIGPDGTIYMATYASLVALRPDGTVKWTFDQPSTWFGAPVVDAEGYVYVTTSEGYLYKLK